jgi:pimeloyl-ACP methyl ester carboxylesterase
MKPAHAAFLHGVPTDHRLWQPVRQRLAISSLAPDLPGYGQQSPLDPPDLEGHIRWLDETLPDPAGLHLVGQDFGGLLAAEWAARRGARSVTLTSSPAGLIWLWPRIAALPGLRALFYERFGGRLYLRRGCAPERRDEVLRLFLPGLSAPDLPGYMRRTAEGISARRLATLPRRLRLCGVPILCLWGDTDLFHPPIVARWTAQTLGGELHWVAGGRHYAPLDRPEAYADALAAFWLRCDRSTA